MRTQHRTERVLAGRYALEETLGKGGMGRVWRAEDRLLQRPVAIKEVLLPAELSGTDRDAVQGRVLREARAAARLTHPSVVTVYDVLQEDGTAYIVMELVEGRTLAEVVSEDGAVPPEKVARIGLDVLSGLERAHAEGIVHRDVKPANVMLDRDGRVKLADFGIASLKGDPKLTQTGILLGSPSFMAPEQAQDLASGPPADLWALGATLYFAVEGVPPFDRGKPIPTLTAVVYDDPRPPQKAGSLALVLTSLLAKDPDNRPSEAQLRAALESAARGAQEASTTRREPARPTVLAPPRDRDEVWRERREELLRDQEEEVDEGPRRGWPLLAAAALLVGLLGVALFTGLRSNDDPASPPARQENTSSRDRDGDGDGANSPSNSQSSDPENESDDAGATDEGGTSGGGAVEASDGTVPSDWVSYTDPENGYRIAHPPGWQIAEDTSGPNSIDVREPGSGTYLRIAWTDSPGADPQEAWEEFAPKFAATHDNYREIQMTPTTYKGYRASLWEFTWSSGAVDLHAYDLGFVTGDQGFALNFQTYSDNWEESQDLWEAFKASFEPPS